MKSIGILYNKKDKKIFLMPNEVKQLTQKGVVLATPSGLGSCLNIPDSDYAAAGMKIYDDWRDVIKNSDIILKVSAFVKPELNLMKDKIAITLVNYLANVDMLYYMLENNVTGLEWKALYDKKYILFDDIEETKASLVLDFLKQSKNLDFIKKEKIVYPVKMKILILNAGSSGVALAKQALEQGYLVTLADNNTKYLLSLKNKHEFKNLNFIDSNFDTLVEQIKLNNVFVNTAINPTDLTKLRITKEMFLSMPKGSMAIDAACEYGYAFHFVKKYADETVKWNKIGSNFYMCHADMTELSARTVSEIISTKTIQYLLEVASSGTNNSVIWKITNCKDGKVVNSFINSKLHLY